MPTDKMEKVIETPVMFDPIDSNWVDADNNYLGHFAPCGESGDADLERCHAIAEALNGYKAAIADAARYREALEHYADISNWEESNANETVTYCVWKDFPREMRNGPDIAQAAMNPQQEGENHD